ncbi:MAG TPA: gfo/Idh/MocA family oxidoreductase [Oceanospirillales bacterium]|nr:oxidoreductase [Oceanospirillaceae bacterium]HBS41673.1 gfo/Idh/MocA family oxidoreductase [Oceanospirillales bacterium]|tara:strand:- start:2500 stop:3582 length:1083 start_codon:yes stop_codon:yes gene_type:complete
MSNPVRVGFIGLNPDSHWAFMAHLPALQSMPDKFVVKGVANSTVDSARRTADALGLEFAFDSAADLVASADIDMVVVTVKVPYHLELVTAALNAGKHVYCEWPLGNGLEEARQLTALAAAKGVVAVSGTQARTAPEIMHLTKLIADGYVGEVLSTTLIGSGGNWSGATIAEYYYLFEAKNGASMQSIPLAHTLAAVKDVQGDFGPFKAQFLSHYKEVTITDTGETKAKTTPDQILVQGQMSSGAALSVHYRGGVSRGTNLLWEINGTEGDIQVTGDLGHAQMIQLTVKGARGDDKELQPLMPDSSVYEGLPEFPGARNIAGIYARMYDDITQGTQTAPTFADAVKLHEIIDAIEASATAQ